MQERLLLLLLHHPQLHLGSLRFLLENKSTNVRKAVITMSERETQTFSSDLPAVDGPQVPSMVLMVVLSSASISFSNSSPLDDSLSPVRYSLISFFFCSGVPFSSTSSSSSELKPRETPQRPHQLRFAVSLSSNSSGDSSLLMPLHFFYFIFTCFL